MHRDRFIWRKSSYSGPNGGDCLEVGYDPRCCGPVDWHRSSHSSSNGGACLEAGRGLATVVPVRDSKLPDSPILAFPPSGWLAFVATVKDAHPTR
ncbi:DUF397 domain-containing protein [Streptomyces bohaiensis]|uniref:DUF397 domain-containing protein n=1 Tax=Streptomyces bohaiensis TaxID=1431344 RepID=UPI003B7EA2B8